MPIIPKIISTQKAGLLQLPRSTPDSFGAAGFKGLAQFGGTMKAVADRIKKDADASEAVRIRVEASRQMTDGILQLDQTADHTNYFTQYSEKEKGIREFVESEAKTKGLSPAASNALNQDIEVWLARQRTGVLQEQRKRTVLHQRATGLDKLSNLAKQAARAKDLKERQDLMEMGRREIKVLTSSGALNAAESRKWRETFEKDVLKQRQAFFDGELQDRLSLLLNKGVTEPENADIYQNEGIRLIDRASADWLPKDKVTETKAAFRNALWEGVVGARIKEDPEGVRDELDAGNFNRQLDPDALIRLKAAADREIYQRDRLAEAERKERERQVGKVVSDFEASKMAGFGWRGTVSERQLAQAVKRTEHEARYLNIVAASAALEKFQRLSPIAQEQLLREESRGQKTGVEVKFIRILEQAHTATKQGLKNDPLTFAVKQGVIPAPQPLNVQDSESLEERSRLARIAEDHYGVSVSPLSDDEAGQIASFLETAPADQRIMLFRQLALGLDAQHIKAVAGQLTKKGDKVTALSMGLSVEAPQVASGILRGKDTVRDNPHIMPSGLDLVTARNDLNSIILGAYQHNSEEHSAVAEAAMNLYAFKSWQARDMSGVYDSDRLTQAVNEVTGGLLTINRGFLRGSFTIQPPRRGMKEGEFEKVLNLADYSAAKGFTAEDIKENGFFESIGDGKYLVKFGPGYVQSDNGPFILDLSNVAIPDAPPAPDVEDILNLPMAAL